MNKMKSIREALDDWKNGNLSAAEALLVIEILITKKRKPSAKIVKIAKEIYENDTNWTLGRS
jgi:hypothetical protein